MTWRIQQYSRSRSSSSCCWIPFGIAAILLYNSNHHHHYHDDESKWFVNGDSSFLYRGSSSSSTSSSFRKWKYHPWQSEQRQYRPRLFHNTNKNNNNYYYYNSCFVPSATLLTHQVSHSKSSILNPSSSSSSSSTTTGSFDNSLPTAISRGGSSSLDIINDDDDNNDDNSNSHNNNNNNNIGTIIGLQNLGNTCYLNAQIQCVYHIPLVRNIILGNYNSSVSVSSLLLSPAQIGLRQLFNDMNNDASNNNNHYSRSAVTTMTFCQLLGIPIHVQQDTQEFWKLLLPSLSIPSLMDLYTGTFINYIRPIQNESTHPERRFLETFLDLSLDVVVVMNPSSSSSSSSSSLPTISIMDALQQQFQQPELLSVAEGNGWRPSQDQPKVDAYKGYQLKRNGLPSILQLHLKRFQFDWNTETTNKLNHMVTFPLTLDLNTIVASDDDEEDDTKTNTNDDDDDDDDCVYELQSVIVHVGEYESGHYYSYVRPNLHTNDWYRFNDEIHTKVRFIDVIQDAYGGIVTTTNADGLEEPKGNRIIRFLRNIFGMDTTNINGYGFGGPKSSAYVLQYIRRSDIPKLYDMVSD